MWRMHVVLRLHQQLCINKSRSLWLRRPPQVQHWSLSLQPPDYDLSIMTRRGNDSQRGALTHSQDIRFVDAAGLPRHVCFNVQILKAKEVFELIWLFKNSSSILVEIAHCFPLWRGKKTVLTNRNAWNLCGALPPSVYRLCLQRWLQHHGQMFKFWKPSMVDIRGTPVHTFPQTSLISQGASF